MTTRHLTLAVLVIVTVTLLVILELSKTHFTKADLVASLAFLGGVAFAWTLLKGPKQ